MNNFFGVFLIKTFVLTNINIAILKSRAVTNGIHVQICQAHEKNQAFMDICNYCVFCLVFWGVCWFCVIIRFFHPHHNGQWPPTSKDFYTRSYPLHYFLILLLEKEPSKFGKTLRSNCLQADNRYNAIALVGLTKHW